MTTSAPAIRFSRRYGKRAPPKPQDEKNSDKLPTAADCQPCYLPHWTKQSAVTMPAPRSYNPLGVRARAQRAEITRPLRAYYASTFAMPLPNSLNSLLERHPPLHTCTPLLH